MERLIEKELLKWKNKPDRKPLMIHGARQVGKTHSMLKLGKEQYKSYAYFFFENNEELKAIFNKGVSDIHVLFGELARYIGQEIKPKETLVIFDEIQACPSAITALKRIQETANEYHVICGGSLLGLALFRDANYSFPVGKIDLLNMYPMSFKEFLMATQAEKPAMLIDTIAENFENNTQMPNHWHEFLLQQYKKYLIVGGMPECVMEYIKNDDWNTVKAKQLAICEVYTNDMVKYCTKTEAMKNIATYNSIPSQLARENRKFQFNLIKSGARSKDFSDSLFWLEKANIVIKTLKVKEGKMPLGFYEDLLSFKIYMADVGLLTAKGNLSPMSILSGDFGGESKGAVTENYVAQELTANSKKPYFWESNNTAELDFVIQLDNEILPIETKSSISTKSKSLDLFRNKYGIKNSMRISAKNFGFENGIKSVPLYAVWCIK
ncbi:MAG: ATP-binding protein [Firmicutes bacterium]|nr:ATP-binding protein [Bacillota bacterium]